MVYSRWLAAVALSAAFAANAWGQSAPPPPELEALRQQVDALTKQLQALEAQYAADKAVTDERTTALEEAKAKMPRLTLDEGGLRARSQDDSFEFRLRFRFAHDWAWFRQDEELKNLVGDEQDGTGFRMARINLQGRFWKDFQYQAELDFAGENAADSPRFRDIFLRYNGIPYFGDNEFDVQVGHFKEPFGLDELNAIVDRQFIENPLLDVFVPTRNTGIQFSDALLGQEKFERLSWAFGIFKETDDWPSSNDSDEDQGYQLTGRLAGLPYYAEEGRKLLHVGAAASLRNPDGARLSYNLRPETRLSLFRYADVESLPVNFRLTNARSEDLLLLGGELAGVYGPFNFQAEYVDAQVETTFGGDLDYNGWYAQAGYLITGEHRPYRHDRGIFGSPKPTRPFAFRGENRGPGAWEVLARYGAVDLTDGPVPGGEHASFTLGLNWYLNSNAKIMANYIINRIDHPLYDGDFEVFTTRFQFEF